MCTTRLSHFLPVVQIYLFHKIGQTTSHAASAAEGGPVTRGL